MERSGLESDYMIRYAEETDILLLTEQDKHISREELKNSVCLKRILVLFVDEVFVGWLRYNLFWDNTPFMNMLYVTDSLRGKGYGKELVTFWENEMRRKGYDRVLTSTLSNEQAQSFYRKLGYTDIGSLLLPDEPLEIIFLKNI